MKCSRCDGHGHFFDTELEKAISCVTCLGTGKQAPVDRIQRYRVLRASTHEGVSISLIEHADGDIYKVNEVDKYVTTLKSELSAARETIGDFNVQEVEHMKQIEKLKAENERLKNKMDEYLDKFNELSLQAVRYRDENERLERCRLITDKSWQELTEENQRYLSAIKTFCDRSKWAVDAWKKQDYIAVLFEIANKESR